MACLLGVNNSVREMEEEPAVPSKVKTPPEELRPGRRGGKEFMGRECGIQKGRGESVHQRHAGPSGVDERHVLRGECHSVPPRVLFGYEALLRRVMQ